jgi:Fe-S cluster assembly scaffold protein SufB
MRKKRNKEEVAQEDVEAAPQKEMNFNWSVHLANWKLYADSEEAVLSNQEDKETSVRVLFSGYGREPSLAIGRGEWAFINDLPEHIRQSLARYITERAHSKRALESQEATLKRELKTVEALKKFNDLGIRNDI